MNDGWGGRADVHGRPAGPATGGPTVADLATGDQPCGWCLKPGHYVETCPARREDQRVSRLVQEAYPRFFGALRERMACE